METPYWYTVLVHQYGSRKSTKTSGVHFFYKSSFFSLENEHTCAKTYLLTLEMVILTAENQEERPFFQRDSIPILVSHIVKTRKFELLYF